ncbi:OPT family small oligopeptide transporter [Microthyrium microscopicum]|uniref:OPT family small oligopeptide transporter n=1 Tax=Microthyrium microscopicum TaxID=703497 RepID=A0A6A6TZZ6_9PEZI|nr:OPT family small oligopeptide transporter [Microthyrium microscopicum]
MRWRQKLSKSQNAVADSNRSQLEPDIPDQARISSEEKTATTHDTEIIGKNHQLDSISPLDQVEAPKYTANDGNKESILQARHEFLDDSPYEEVRAAVSNTDDGSIANTIRAWILGILFVTVVAAINMLLSMRQPAITIPTVVVILLVYPVGEIWARTVPMRKFRTFGIEWTLNSGPWTIKEHTVVTLMANVTSGYPYSTNALEALQAKSLYNHNMGWGFALLFTLSSQVIGISLAGLYRRFTVWPASLIWPGNFSTTSLLYTLHDKSKADPTTTNGWIISRYRYFFYVCSGMFLYYWFPGVIWQGLSVFAFITWIKPNDVVINQLFGGFTGLSLIPITFDFTYINNYLQNPLLSPWPSHFNTLIGLIIFVVVSTLGIAYTGSLYSEYLPINTSRTYDNTGNRYDVKRILTADFQFDEAKYKKYSPMFLAPTFALNYGLSFASLMAAIVHTTIFHRREIATRLKNSRAEEPDIHMRLVAKYPEVPEWWYGALWLCSTAFGLAAVLAYPTQLPWWAFIVSCLIALIFILPLCLIQGVTNIQLALNVLSPYLAGYLLPGRPIGVMLFKVFSTIVVGNAQVFTSDLKLAHYMKIPPRTTFSVQIVAIIWSVFVQIATMNWVLANIPLACDPKQESHFTCPNGSTFFSSSIVWGVIGPARMFGPGSIYRPILWFWLLGALLPIAFCLLTKKFPRSFVRHLNAPVMLGAMGWLPPATPLNFSSWAIVGLIFNYWVRRRWSGWWKTYNYITAAALDTGLVLCTIVIFFAITLPGAKPPKWWGNTTVMETMDQLGTAVRIKLPEGEKFGPKTW